MANFMRKIKKKKAEKNKGINSAIKEMKKMFGVSDNGKTYDKDTLKMIENQIYGSVDNPNFPSNKNIGRIRDLKLDEEGLLQKFSSNYFKESFEMIQKYVERHEYIRSIAYMKNSFIDIDMIKICLSKKELKEFFDWQYDYCTNRINYIVDLIEYSTNKSYKKVIKRIEKSFSENIDTSKMDLMLLADNIVHILRGIQNRYIDTAPFVAKEFDMKLETYEDLLKAYEKYNQIVLDNNSNSDLTKSLNEITNKRNATDQHLIERIEKISKLYTKNSIRLEKVDISLKTEEEINNKKEDLLSKIEDIEIIGNKFIKSDKTFDYSKVVEYSKSSKDSVQKILKIEMDKYNKIFSIITSIFELSLLFKMRELVNTNEGLKESIQEIYENEIENLFKKYIGDFYLFCINEKIDIAKKQDYNRLNSKFIKKVLKKTDK